MSNILVDVPGLDELDKALEEVRIKAEELAAAASRARAVRMEVTLKINQPSTGEADG